MAVRSAFCGFLWLMDSYSLWWKWQLKRGPSCLSGPGRSRPTSTSSPTALVRAAPSGVGAVQVAETGSAYARTHPGSVPAVKHDLAAIRMLGDWLVVSQVLPVNPAAAVRGSKHVVTKGATPGPLAGGDESKLLETIRHGRPGRAPGPVRPRSSSSRAVRRRGRAGHRDGGLPTPERTPGRSRQEKHGAALGCGSRRRTGSDSHGIGAPPAATTGRPRPSTPTSRRANAGRPEGPLRADGRVASAGRGRPARGPPARLSTR